jgi:hypothetical protein
MYAKYTTVAVSKSKQEIEHIIAKYKGDQYGIMTDSAGLRAAVQFRIDKWIVRFELKLPSANEENQQVKSRWRALLLAIKAKLESVESNIESFEEAFLPHIVMPDGRRFSTWVQPQLTDMRDSGTMPQTLLPPPSNQP